METIIRKITPSDYTEVVLLWRNEIGNPNVNEENITSVMTKMNKDDNYRTFVAVCENRVVAFITTLQALSIGNEVGFLWICGLAVSQAFQNKGIGTKLLNYIEKYACERRLSSIILNSGFERKEAHAFYEINGYEKHSYCFTKKPNSHQ
ncbi:GNAT family N-acetyltransferase [Clostridium sp. 'deep sea']|uniref:GNAT family N-acetyltransferase n=1 Tax=Clostridium sp. 'deep sea' TaxID=2779445 RepID=UPI0018967715|nr:GNAT family N-acetyltransferase [Clostridium sp. 'deep sea']QOR34354.1 GNAT family N-acetyltransferase [Clostridium sp. 'deep sea']